MRLYGGKIQSLLQSSLQSFQQLATEKQLNEILLSPNLGGLFMGLVFWGGGGLKSPPPPPLLPRLKLVRVTLET